MGLDSVDILMKTEDCFRIKIPVNEAERINTVGDFHEAVWRQCVITDSTKCLSQQLFYRLRKAFTAESGYPRHLLQTDSSPESIFPTANRRQVYHNLALTLNLTLPALALPVTLANILVLFALLSISGLLVYSLIQINAHEGSKFLLLLPFSGILLIYCLSKCLAPFRTKINDRTMCAFVQHKLAMNYSAMANSNGTNRKEIEKTINYIIADHAGLDITEITKEKRIADDLGID